MLLTQHNIYGNAEQAPDFGEPRELIAGRVIIQWQWSSPGDSRAVHGLKRPWRPLQAHSCHRTLARQVDTSGFCTR